jgi:hypothetical protein
MPVGLVLFVLVLLTSPGSLDRGRVDRYFASGEKIAIRADAK